MNMIFSASHPSNDAQGGKYEMCPPPFNNPHIISHDFHFTQPQPRKNYSAQPNSLKGVDKKPLQKEMERERRKDMKSRYSALRSLLPAEYIRGKSSFTDQLSQAIDYIRDIQKMIGELAKKRDNMKKMSMRSHRDQVYNSMPCNEWEAFPVVNVNVVGSGVVVATITSRGQMVLSKLVDAVEKEGLEVLTATSLSTDGKVFHTVHCKVSDVQSFKSSTGLHQKLCQLIA